MKLRFPRTIELSILGICLLVILFGPFNIWWNIALIIGIILLIVLIFFIFRVIFYLVGYSVALGLEYKTRIEENAWDYYHKMKHYKWCELSEEEKNKLLNASMIIYNDCGMVISVEEARKALEEGNVPIE